MRPVVTFERDGRRYVVEKLTQCEECGQWVTSTMEIDLVPGKPPLRLCLRDFLTAMSHRVENVDAATGDGGNAAPVDGSAESLSDSALVCGPEPVAASAKPKKPRPRKARAIA